MRRRRKGGLAAVITLLALFGPLSSVGAEPYEDGGAPAAPSWYASTPRQGWRTSSSADRVHDIAQIGNRIYVAGTFRGIRYGTQGAVSNRSYLVAFDANSGEPVWSFDPRFDAAVFTLAVAGDGSRLYAGGQFQWVDGRARQGLVALTPGGDVVEGWRANATGGTVRSIVATRSYLYAGGSFRRIDGVVRRGLARLHLAGGGVDAAWNAWAIGGTVLTIELPPSRNRVYVGGRFASINGWVNTSKLAALRTEDGRIDARFGRQPGRDVFDLLADGRGRVWAALDGTGGRAELYDNGGRVLGGWGTDGDVQTVERIGSRVYFGGHELVPNDRQVATVDYDRPGPWDTSTFRPGVGGGDGVWALHADGDDLWIGAQSRAPFTGVARYPAR